MKNNIFNDLSENKNVKSFNTNNNNQLKGEIDMKTNKGDIEILTKKEFKALSKGQAYDHYELVLELANNLKIKTDEALELFKSAKMDLVEVEEGMVDIRFKLGETKTKLVKTQTKLGETQTKLGETQTELAETKTNLLTKLGETQTELAETKTELAEIKTELAENKTELAETQTQLEEKEIKLAEAQGKNDAGFDLAAEIQNDLDELTKDVAENREAYKRLGARMTGKRARANINTGTIRHYKNIIQQCKKDIENGKDVDGNKATIFELEAEIRNLQRQVDAANGTFNEMKRNKTIVSQKLVKMDNELDKRYKLQNLLGEFGYI